MADTKTLPFPDETSALPDLFSNATLIFVIIITILTGYHFWFQSLRHVKLGNKIPGVPGWPIFGNALEGLTKPEDLLEYATLKVKEVNSPILRIWYGPRLIVGLLDPKDIEIFIGGNDNLAKSNDYQLFEPWLGDGLLISKGEKWKSHRKMIAPTFHKSILKTFIPIFNKNAEDLVESLKKELGKVFDVHDYMSTTTVDILLETAMGVKKSKEDKTGFDYAMAVMNMCSILHQRHYKFWLRPNIIFNWTKMAANQKKFLDTIHGLTNKVIKLKKNDFNARENKGESSLYSKAVKSSEFAPGSSPENKNNYFDNNGPIQDDLDEIDENDVGEKKRLAFLDFMIEASHMKGNNLTDKDIQEEVNTIMFEGHDTTAAACSFFLCILGVHQDIQEKVLTELNEIFEGKEREVTLNDIMQMKYLERVLMETLRLYPPVPIITREAGRDIKMASGDYTIPKGSTVVILPYFLHHREDLFPDPEKFNPDNFLPERCAQRNYYSYIPFSAGPRSCVGRKYALLKMKVILATVLRKYKFISTVSQEDFKLRCDIILKRNDGFQVRIEERQTV